MFRIVRSQFPDDGDFCSAERLGRHLRPPITPQLLRSWRSVSVWDTREAAEARALRMPRLGRWIAVLELPDNVVRSPFGEPGHWDIEADPAELMQAIIEVIEVRR